jgi:hypothetical protein
VLEGRPASNGEAYSEDVRDRVVGAGLDGPTIPENAERLAWFAECGVDTVAMESTSVHWIPIVELRLPTSRLPGLW